ncbi:hypothetical protein QQF64_008671 [Cirrhinus molitorella]|uniref:Secreted protein n=1 Tax=Cirrhinus molitorella TaxID=172907 RepID=A0ABR3M9V9_9TELE
MASGLNRPLRWLVFYIHILVCSQRSTSDSLWNHRSRKKSPTAEKRVSIKACLTRPRCLEGVKRGAKTWRGQVANTSVYWSIQQPSSSCFLDLSAYRGCARTSLGAGVACVSQPTSLSLPTNCNEV